MTLVRTSPFFFSLLLVLSASACTDRRVDGPRDNQPAPADAPASLTLAHEAYLAGDYVEMGERIRDTLIDKSSGELARENAYALLESAYDATHGQLPARATLPSGMKVITLGVMNGVNPWGTHRMIFINMRVFEGRAAHVKDIRLTRLSPGSLGEPAGELILALAEGRGALRVTHDTKGFEDVAIDVRHVEVLPDRGAFEIQVLFDDAPAFDAFVLANKLVASTQPELTSPDVGQVFNDPHPEIAWHPYRSPELMPWEQRSVHVGIQRDSTKESAWTFDKWAPGDLGDVHVGDPGTPTAALEPDSYWMSVMCLEERTFGAVRLSRATETGRPFSVVR